MNPGVTVARAKRTTRAEARRRYRAEHGLLDDTNLDDDSAETVAAPAVKGGASRSGPDQPARIGILSAARLAFRPLDAPGDIRALPGLVTNKALWLPVLLTIAAAVATGVSRGSDVLSQFAFQYFVVTPAIGGVFIAGFLAPRASWLLGVIVGLVSAICYTILGYAGLLPAGFAEVFALEPSAAIVSSFVFSPIMGALFASAAAWYRRFLQLSSPNRGRNRPPARRGNDGRSRSTSGQKAGARR
jgi:hypothetical protein